MRIATFESQGTERIGVVEGEAVRPFPDDVALLDLLAADPETRTQAAAGAGAPVALDAVRLLPPRTGGAVRDFVAFEQHIEGVTMGHGGVPPGWYERPTFVMQNPHAALGAHDDVAIPAGCELMDFECELAAVVGRDARDVTPERASEHIAGFMIWNDWSARDLQRADMAIGLGPAKGKDFANTFGPWIVTADELEPYRRGDRLDLEMTVWINDKRIGGDRSSSMAWSFEELLTYAARAAWVKAGDILGSGTCGGGALAELWGRAGGLEPPPLRAGDVVTMTIEAIGTIRSRLVAGPPEAAPIPRARARTAAA